jgi:hypothetical protein
MHVNQVSRELIFIVLDNKNNIQVVTSGKSMTNNINTLKAKEGYA